MILLFTSDHCMMCNMIKGMLEEEEADIRDTATVYEVNVEKHPFIAEAYGIMVVPTLVAGCKALYGVPCESELRSFLLQAAVGSPSHEAGNDLDSALAWVHHNRLPDTHFRDTPCVGRSETVSAAPVFSSRISQNDEHPKETDDREKQSKPPLQN